MGNPFSHGRFLSPQVVKGTFFGTFFHARAERKYEKERRRTAVVAFADVNGVLQPYAMAVTLRREHGATPPTVDNLTYTF